MAVVLITGCSSGFGMLAALEFARRGDTVVATMRRPERAATLLAAAAADDLDLEVVALDVTDDASVATGVAEAERIAGPVDVLVNNAGVASAGAIEAVPDEVVRRLFETNVFGVVRMWRAVLPGMRARGSGALVQVSSAAGLLPGSPFDGYYYATKHALEAMTEALAYEVEPFGIRVALVEPGLYKTEIAGNLLAAGVPGVVEAYAERQERRLQARLEALEEIGGDPREVAIAIVEAASRSRPPLRWPLGPQIDSLVPAIKAMDEEQRAAWIRSRLPD